MNDLQQTDLVTVNLRGKKHELLFGVRAINEVQHNFDIDISELDSLFDEKKRERFSNIAFVLALLINEAIKYKKSDEPLVEMEDIERVITLGMTVPITTAIFDAFTEGMPELTDNEEEESPNGTSE